MLIIRLEISSIMIELILLLILLVNFITLAIKLNKIFRKWKINIERNAYSRLNARLIQRRRENNRVNNPANNRVNNRA